MRCRGWGGGGDKGLVAGGEGRVRIWGTKMNSSGLGRRIEGGGGVNQLCMQLRGFNARI